MADIDIKRVEGDTNTPLRINLKTRGTDPDTTSAFDMTGFSCYLYIRLASSSTNLSEFNALDVTASLDSPVTGGTLTHTLTANQAAQLVAGNYYVMLKADDGAGDVKWFPDDLIGSQTKDKLYLTVSDNFA